MDENFIKLFSLNKTYLVLSEKTNQPYIDSKRCCYFLESITDAKQFCATRKGTKLDELKFYPNIATLVDKLYLLGAEKLRIKLAKNNIFNEYIIKEEDLKKNRYENHDAEFNLALHRETGEDQYIINLFNCNFIAPVVLPRREERDYPQIKYGVVRRECKNYNVIFTTMQEFHTWLTHQTLQYYPLLVDFLKAKRIRGENGVIINPETTRMIIECKEIDEIGRRLKK